MKKLIIFEINDGCDGVVVAKSLKHAIKKLVPYYGYTTKDVMDGIKQHDKNSNAYVDWELTSDIKVAKKGAYKKSRLLGWIE